MALQSRAANCGRGQVVDVALYEAVFSLMESLLPGLKERPWFKAGSVYLLVENDYDSARSRLNTEYTFVSDGRVEIRRGSQRVYPFRELIELVEAAGFTVAPDEKWTRASHTLTLVGTRT
jgi:hypothetical protein